MTDEQFEAKVAELRQAQKNYFATRDRSYLEQSKSLEREIDEELEARKDKKQRMFDLDPDTPEWCKLDKEMPDVKDGAFVSFMSRVGVTYVQIRHDRNVYIKTVLNDGRISTMTFVERSAEDLLKYFATRIEETKEGAQ